MSGEAVAGDLQELRRALRSRPGARLAIPQYGYPDPDSMASAWALAELAAHEGVPADVLHIDPVSHAQNRVMARDLGVPLTPWADAVARGTEYAWLGIVDAAVVDPRYGALAQVPCLCVWDHHAGEPAITGRVNTILTDVGSTCTLAVWYLDAAGLLTAATELRVSGTPPPGAPSAITRLATALMVGIATDTDDFRLARPVDFRAAARAAELADLPSFRRIHRRAYSPAAMKVLHRALDSLVVRDSFGIAWVGNLPPILRDSIPQAADLLVSRLDLDTVVVFGHVGSMGDGSLRTLDPAVDTGTLIARALRLGEERAGVSGGGREGKGGFRWSLEDDAPAAIEAVRAQIERGFLDAATGD